MSITISRGEDQRWNCAGSMFFAGFNEVGDAVTVDVSQEAWETIMAHYPDRLGKVEQMANDPRATWHDFGADKVLRVYL